MPSTSYSGQPSKFVVNVVNNLAAVPVVAAALGGTLLDGGSLDVWGAFAPLEEVNVHATDEKFSKLPLSTRFCLGGF